MTRDEISDLIIGGGLEIINRLGELGFSNLVIKEFRNEQYNLLDFVCYFGEIEDIPDLEFTISISNISVELEHINLNQKDTAYSLNENDLYKCLQVIEIELNFL